MFIGPASLSVGRALAKDMRRDPAVYYLLADRFGKLSDFA
jgi:hypothetical protein